MKSLKNFIKESLESSKKDTKYFKLNLSNLECSISKIITAAEKDGLFVEKTDYGCKVKISNNSKTKHIVGILNTIIDDNSSNEDILSDVESLSNKLQEIIDFTTPKEDDENSEKDKKSKKNEEE